MQTTQQNIKLSLEDIKSKNPINYINTGVSITLQEENEKLQEDLRQLVKLFSYLKVDTVSEVKIIQIAFLEVDNFSTCKILEELEGKNLVVSVFDTTSESKPYILNTKFKGFQLEVKYHKSKNLTYVNAFFEKLV